MKKILLFILLFTSLNAQDHINPRKLDYLSASSYTASSATTSFIDYNYSKSKFILGWNWGSGGTHNLDEALHINTYHRGKWGVNWNNILSSSNFEEGSSAIMSLDNVYGGRVSPNNFLGLGLYLEPALNVSTSSTFKPNIEADYGSAFGFQNKNLSIGSNTIVSVGSNTFGCFHLSQSSLTVSSAIILSDIYPKKALRFDNNDDGVVSLNKIDFQNTNSKSITDKNGITWNLSINLRASELLSSNTFADNTPVLKIKLPYTFEDHSTTLTNYSNSFINFSYLPISSGTTSSEIEQINAITMNASNTYTDFRGVARKMSTSETFTSEFIITKGMLRADANNSNSFITLSAKFYSDGKLKSDGSYQYNPIFKPLSNISATTSYISSIDVEVEYLGMFDLDMNWIRFETPNLQKITRGAYDQQIYTSVMDAMNNGFGSSTANTSNTKFFRFYNDDELINCQYEQSRYVNLLLDTNVSTETFYTNVPDDESGINFIPHFFYGTGYKQFWSGTNLTASISNYIAAPYYRIEDDKLLDGDHNHSELFNIGAGYLGYPGKFLNTNYPGGLSYSSATFLAKDTINSMYETHFSDFTSPNSNSVGQYYPSPSYAPFSSTQSYLLFDKNDRFTYGSLQQRIDGNLSANFKSTPEAYYNNEHWVNVWLGMNFNLVNKHTTSSTLSPLFTTIEVGFDSARPITGEELRLSLYSELIKGVKGFMVWSTMPRYKNSNTFGFDNGLNGFIYDIDGINTTSTYTFYGGVQTGSSSSTSYNLIYSNEIGSDFVNTVTSGSITSSTFDPDYYHQFYKPEELNNSSNTLGRLSSNFYDFGKLYIKPSRVYIGRKSQRVELYKTFSFIHENEKLLLDIGLQAYKNKGFISFSNKNPSSTLTINDFIDTINIKTRPIGRVKDDKAYYENETIIDGLKVDSAFYEVSILSSPASMTLSNPSGSFCLAVVNRRSDPLIRNLNVAGSNTFNEMQFYTTAEFDENSTKTISTKDIYGVDRSPDWWQKQWWLRLGCREISIPMKIKYKDVNNIEKYALLKVTELKGNEIPIQQGLFGSTLSSASQTSIVNSLYPKVDKVIGQDGSIVTNYLPGEGKIFKIQILPPGELKGKLDNINQNKMVSMPIYNNGTITDKVIHYVTYYNYDTDIQKKRVYLAISQPTNQNALNSNIDWHNIIPVSDNALLFTCFNPSKTVNFNSSTFYDSYHPSIVVRQDGDNHKVFIAYSLIYPVPYMGNSNINSIYIMENVYNVTTNTLIPTASSTYNREIGYVLTDGNDYGTPTVNSAKDVLFYAWSGLDVSTFLPSIYYSYKTPNQTGVNEIKYIRNQNNLFPDCSESTKLLHPSLNTYSTTVTKFGNDNYATLVWEQTACSNSSSFMPANEIFMTFLKFSSNTLTYFLPELYPWSIHRNQIVFYNAYQIIKFKQGFVDLFPSVYQNLELHNYLPWEEALGDYIAFESSPFFQRGTIKIIPLYFSHYDNYWEMGASLTLKYSKNRWYGSDVLDLTKPTIKQGSSLFNNLPLNPYSKALVNLNFHITNSNKECYQFYMNEGSYFGSIDGTANVYYSNTFAYNLSLITKNSDQNHLSASPLLNNNLSTYRNRRIFETGEDYSTLQTSARYFYKKNANDLEVQGYFGYKTDTTQFYIGDIIFNNTDLEMILPFTKTTDSTNGNKITYNNNDTIYSKWINLGTSSNLNFKLYGKNVSNSLLYIERQDSTSIYPINATTISNDTLCRQVNVTLINGNNHNYRFAMKRIDTLGIYDEIIALNGIQVADTVYFKGHKNNMSIIDLSGKLTMSGGDQLILNVTPNPAENEVYAIAYIPSSHLIERQTGENKLVISLYNSIGMLIKEIDCVSGETIKFDLRELGNGNYFVKAREKTDSFIEECKPVQRNLIIKK